MKRILSIFLCLTFLIGVFAVPIVALEAPENIATSAVMTDLANMSVEGRRFNEVYYPKSNSADYVRILSFLEYGYDYAGDQKDYGIYVYVYNPACKNFLTEGNKIQIAAGKSENTVGLARKYPLTEISRSGDNRFIKYKVSNLKPNGAVTEIYNLLDRTERIYQISGIELKLAGSTGNAKDYDVSGTYVYSGYLNGYGLIKSSSSTLYCKAQELNTIELDIRGATWRSETSSAGLGHKNEIASVYFGIDNEILENYGYLYKVEGEFYENKIGSIVTTSQELYSAFENLAGVKVSDLYGYDASLGYSLSYPYIVSDNSKIIPGPPVVQIWDYGFNRSLTNNLGYSGGYERLSKITPYSYKVNRFVPEGDIDVTWSEHLENIQKTGLYTLEPTVYRDYVITLGDKLSLKSYKDTHNRWDYFWESGFGLLWDSIPEEDLSNIPMLEVFDSSDLSLSDRSLESELYIDDAYLNDFRAYVLQQEVQKKTVHILRFAANDYFSVDCLAQNYPDGSQVLSSNAECYYAEQTYYDDFDILRLTFMDEYGNTTPFLVVSDPIVIIGRLGDIRAQINKKSENENSENRKERDQQNSFLFCHHDHETSEDSMKQLIAERDTEFTFSI